MKIKPLHDRVLIEPFPAETKTAGGIYIPENIQKKPERGTVVACGNGKEGFPMTVKEGDIVIYAKHSGTEITYEGVDYLIMREGDIYATI